MEIQIVQVPYDSGHENVRTGKGPIFLLEKGLDGWLRGQGHGVHVSRVRSDLTLPTENGTTFDTLRLLADQVQAAVNKGRFPLILAGNCNSCVGTLAGITNDRPGVVWFDAHGDFNTPDTTTTGFLDGMGLAMACGRCWKSLVNAIPGSRLDIAACAIASYDPALDEGRSYFRAVSDLVAAIVGDPDTRKKEAGT